MIRYLLAMTATADLGEFEETIRSFDRHVRPVPTSVFVYNDGSRARATELARVAASIGTTAVEIAGNLRRRRGLEYAYGQAWNAAGARKLAWALLLPDGYRFRRTVDLTDVAHVLSMEPTIAQMVFLDQRGRGGLSAAYEMKGSAIRWLSRRNGFEVAPALVRASVAKSFPWPDSAEKLEIGIRSSLPETRFAAWGVGDPWVERRGL